MIKEKLKYISDHPAEAVLIAASAILFTLYVGGLIVQLTSMDIFVGEEQHISFNPIIAISINFTKGMHGVLAVLAVYAFIALYLHTGKKEKSLRNTEDDERGFKIEKSGVYGTAKLLKKEEVKDYAEVEPLIRTRGLIIGKYAQKTTLKSIWSSIFGKRTVNDKRAETEVVSIPPDSKRFKYDASHRAVVKTDANGVKTRVREHLRINGNRHCMVMGPSGCGKSYCYSLTAIFQSIRQGESIIVTDPKGELYGKTSVYAEHHGYTVKILNLFKPEFSDSWNALAEVKGAQIGIEAQNFCNIIIDNTSNPNTRGDEVYSSGEKNLLTALVLYVLTAPLYTGEKTLGGVYQLLSDNSADKLDMFFNQLEETNPAKAAWNIFSVASPALKGNLMLGLGVRLQTLQDETIRNITGIPDIDLTLPGKVKCAYYVIMSDMNDTFKFISSLFFSCLFSKLVEYSRLQVGQKLPVSINVIMDEFVAIGKLPDFEKKISTVRSAGINISMIFQTLAQLENMYPNGMWETLVANCATILCLQCNDVTTAKYFSERSGTATISVDNQSIQKSMVGIGHPETVSHTFGVGQRNIMNPNEVLKLAHDKVLVSILGADLFTIDKFPYTDMIDPSTLHEVLMQDHVPAWVQQMQSDAATEPIQPVNIDYHESTFSRRKTEAEDAETVNEDEDLRQADNATVNTQKVQQSDESEPARKALKSDDDDVLPASEIVASNNNDIPELAEIEKEQGKRSKQLSEPKSNTKDKKAERVLKEF